MGRVPVLLALGCLLAARGVEGQGNQGGRVCCQAMTASCLACQNGVSLEQYCYANPQAQGCPRVCCQAMTASCLACQAGVSVEQYCQANPQTQDCPRACCAAMTASCLACTAGMTEEQYCALNPDTAGCPRVCCQAMTASCLACQGGVSVEQYCEENPQTQDCPRACCRAMTAQCLSCAAGLTEEQYCAQNPDTAGCPAPVEFCPDSPPQVCKMQCQNPGCAADECAMREGNCCDLKCKPVNFEAPRPCCKAMTAQCLSCAAGLTEEQYCAQNPDTAGCPRVCCQAMTASCLACQAGVSVEQYCQANPQTQDCPRVCCKALTSQCLACEAGLTEEQYCAQNPNTAGCPPRICCKALTASCLACAAGQTEEEYCALNPDTVGCCCTANTAECRSCQEDQSLNEYCRENPKTDGCAGVCCKNRIEKGKRTGLGCWACYRGQTKEEFCDALRAEPTEELLAESPNSRKKLVKKCNKKYPVAREQLAITVSAGGDSDSATAVRARVHDDKAPVNCDMSVLSVGSVATNVMLAVVIVILAVVVCRGRNQPQGQRSAEVERESTGSSALDSPTALQKVQPSPVVSPVV